MRSLILCIGFGLAALGGCSGPRFTDDAQFRAEASAPYRLASGDRLRVLVFGQDQLTIPTTSTARARFRCR